MVELKKIKNGLSWNDREWLFTQDYLENGYEVIDDLHISSELEGNVVCFLCTDTIVDGSGPFNDSQELLYSIYGELP